MVPLLQGHLFANSQFKNLQLRIDVGRIPYASINNCVGFLNPTYMLVGTVKYYSFLY